MFSVAIADPLEVWSMGMATILGKLGCELIGRWPALDEATPCPGFGEADLLILSRRLVPRHRGEALVRPLSGEFQGPIILVLEPEDDFSADDFVIFDVEGLILSSAPIQSVIDCIDSVRRGRQWVDPGVRQLLGHTPHHAQNWQELSGREHDVARLAALGLSNKQIARELEVSDGTVKMHMHHILSKLHISNRSELLHSFGEGRPGRANVEIGKMA